MLASKKSSRMPGWHPPDSDSGMVQYDESTIHVSNDANACFFQDSTGQNVALTSEGETKTMFRRNRGKRAESWVPGTILICIKQHSGRSDWQ